MYYDDYLNKEWNQRLDKHKKEMYELKNKNKNRIFEKIYDLKQIHIYRPKIKNYKTEKAKTYIKYIINLFKINEEKAIEILKKYNNDVYKTILFYDFK